MILAMVFTGCGVSEPLDKSETVQVPDANTNGSEYTADPPKNEMQPVDAQTFWEWRSERNGCKAGNVFTFGEWRGQPIEWRVLAIQDDKALVVSEKLLALRQYQDYSFDGKPGYGDYNYSTWAECSLRSWLNNDFLKAAFSEQEKQAISLTSVKTPEIDRTITTYTNGNELYEKIPVHMQASKDTEDMVFCLSVDEAETYFCWDDMRIASMTVTEQDYDYAAKTVEAIGSGTDEWWYVFGGYEPGETAPKMWWLRNGTYVNPYGGIWLGSISGDGEILRGWPCGVRPAMWLQLDA